MCLQAMGIFYLADYIVVNEVNDRRRKEPAKKLTTAHPGSLPCDLHSAYSTLTWYKKHVSLAYHIIIDVLH